MIKETKETKTKKNPDYSKTIVNQTNADEVKTEIDTLAELKLDLEQARKILKEMPEYQEFLGLGVKIAEQTTKVKDAIDKRGSYQDIENGVYGLKYQTKSTEYNEQSFMARYPQYVPAVIVQRINPDALKGLIKGKLLTLDELEGPSAGNDSVITYKTGERYYIK